VLPVYATAAGGWGVGKAPDDPSLRLYSDLGVDAAQKVTRAGGRAAPAPSRAPP
jgi:hypothetical protein